MIHTNTSGDKMKNINIGILDGRIFSFKIIIYIFFALIAVKLVIVNIIEKDLYNNELKKVTNKVVESNSVPRGRIYDRNYNLLVDNVAVKTIYYKKASGVTVEEEIKLAYKMSRIINIDYSNLKLDKIKDFWILTHKTKAYQKLTKQEKENYENRKLAKDDIYKLQKERINNIDLSIYDEWDKKAIYIYYLMNKGYYYDSKIIKKDNITDFEYAYISYNVDQLKGFSISEDWERIYLYKDTLRDILGSISTTETGIPYEQKKYYLDKGYALNDRVGISGLEYQYESILKGEKEKYLVNSDYSLELLKEGKRGMDIVLTIDINLQQKIEKILEEEILKAKKMPNTKYYDHSFVIIEQADTGEILALAGKKINYRNNNNYSFTDITYAINNETIQPGSIVKGASMTVGYNSGVVKIGSTEYDTCIKIKNITKKCSWRNLGLVNDLQALKYSSNVFQYKTAIKIGGGKYCYNCPIKINPLVFNIYRGTFFQYGLGVKTGIDLPNESAGYIGGSSDPTLIIDYAIGQYDTYTPIQISQYITTIANNGNRLQPHLLKSIHSSINSNNLGEKLYEFTPNILNKVKIDDKYLNRIKEGFRAVITSGTGVGYIDNKYKGAGKTGTSESFIDTNNDKMIDTKTNTKNFIGYAPYDDPKMTIAVMSPNISYPSNNSSYLYNVTKIIANKSIDAYFNTIK